jgi:hypothetical protein
MNLKEIGVDVRVKPACSGILPIGGNTYVCFTYWGNASWHF